MQNLSPRRLDESDSRAGSSLNFNKHSGDPEALWIENFGCHETLRNPCLLHQFITGAHPSIAIYLLISPALGNRVGKNMKTPIMIVTANGS